VKKPLLVLILVGVALAGLAYWISQSATRPVTKDLFTYAQVTRGPMIEAVSASALVQPRDIRVVSSELPGIVVEVPAKVNDVVAPGDVLVRLDARKFRLELEEAQAAVAQAEALQRAAELAVKYQQAIERSGGFRSDLEAAEAQLNAARPKVQAARLAQEKAQLALDLTLIRAPMDNGSGTGRQYHVLDKKVQPGQFIGPQTPLPLFTLASDLRRMEIHAEVAEGDVGRVRPGLESTFTVAAYWEPEVKFRGTVREIRPVPANVKGAIFYTTVTEVENAKDQQTGEWMLRPGMTASVDVITRKRTNVWRVPTAALNFQMEEPYQNEAVRARLASWRERSDPDDWRPLWVWDEARRGPWPLFVRIGGLKNGESGLKDGEFNEILEWEPGTEPTGPGPRVIIHAPPARRPGLLDQPANIKLS